MRVPQPGNTHQPAESQEPQAPQPANPPEQGSVRQPVQQLHHPGAAKEADQPQHPGLHASPAKAHTPSTKLRHAPAIPAAISTQSTLMFIHTFKHPPGGVEFPTVRSLRRPAVASCFPNRLPLPNPVTRRTLMPAQPTLPPDRFDSLSSGHATPPDPLRAALPGGQAGAPNHVPPASTKPSAPSAQPTLMFFPTCATHRAASSSLPSARLRPPAVASTFPIPAPLPTALTRRTLMPYRPTLPADRFGSLPCGHTTPPDHCAPPSLTVTPRAPKREPPSSTKPLPTPPIQPSCSSTPSRPTGRRRVPSRSVTPRRPIGCAPPALTVTPRAPKHVPPTSTERSARATRPQGPPAMPDAAQHACHASRDLGPDSPHVHPRLHDPPAASSALQIGHTTPPDRLRAALPVGKAARPETCTADFSRAIGAGNATARPTDHAQGRAIHLACLP